MKKERIEYLDLIKGISMLLVVFCHRVTLSHETIWGNIVMAIAWAAVPNFFLVSGGLMHQAIDFHWKKYFCKLLRIYLVLCVWKIMYFIFFSVLGEVTWSKVDLVKYLFLFSDLSGVDTGPLWFMYAYLMVMLFYPVSLFFYRTGRKGQQILLFILVVLFVQSFLVTAGNFMLSQLSEKMGCNLLQISISVVIPYGSYTNMLFFFILGAFLFGFRYQIMNFMKQCHCAIWLPAALGVGGTAGLVFVKYCMTGSTAWNGVYIDNGYGRLMTVILAIGLYLFFLNCPVRKVGIWTARQIGTRTMGIFYMHMPVLALFQMKFGGYYGGEHSFILNVLKTAAAVGICVLVTVILKKIPLIRELVR